MENKNNIAPNVVEEEGFSIKQIISYFFAYWKLFLLSFVLFMAVAFFYLRNAVPSYNVVAKILLQDREKGSFSSSADMLADFGFQSNNTNVENEIEVINSLSVVKGAVYDTEMYISYKIPAFNDIPLYKADSPLKVAYGADAAGNVDKAAIANLEEPLSFLFNIDENGVTNVSYSCYANEDDLEPTEYNVAIEAFPYVLETPVGNVLVENNPEVKEYAGELAVTILPLDVATRLHKSTMVIAPLSKMTSVAQLAVNTTNPQQGVDFLNAVIDSYNKVTNEDKRQVARQTEEFIIERIDSLNKELQVMETRLSKYKKDNQLISPQINAQETSKNKIEYTKQLEEIDLMIKSSEYLTEFVNNKANDMKVIPTTFGLTIDQSLLALINNYNKEVVARNQLLLTATEGNPALKNITIRVQQMQADLRVAIKAFDGSLRAQREAISTLLAMYVERYESSPDVERELMTIERECKIKSDLYVMLLQKYEENALSLAVTANNLRCIDAPENFGRVSPNSKMIFLLALFAALAIPALFVYIRESMRTQITANDDLATLTTLPCVGNVPVKHSVKSGKTSIVVRRNKNDIMAEAFRTLRTNLQFVMKKSTGSVIMFTSTTSGEGKTFVASNLAVSAAMLGKKVLLLGLDIRRPRLAEVFGFSPDLEGITSYLAADEKDTDILDKNIIPSGVDENLFLLPAGIVPPNPAELLARPNLDKAFEYLSKKFDYLILDSAPVGLVTDSMIISRVADAVCYVMRFDYTQKADVKYLNGLVEGGKLEHVSIVMNGEDIKKKMFAYTRNRRGSNPYVGYGYVSYGDEKKK